LSLSLFVFGTVADKHEDITKSEWDVESAGKKIFLDMYAEW